MTPWRRCCRPVRGVVAGPSCKAPSEVKKNAAAGATSRYKAERTVGHAAANKGYCPFTGAWASRGSRSTAAGTCKAVEKGKMRSECLCSTCKPAKKALHDAAIGRDGFGAWVQAQGAELDPPAKLAATTARYSGAADSVCAAVPAAGGTGSKAAARGGKRRQRPADGDEQAKKK